MNPLNDPLEGELPPARAAKRKNTKDWCKGKKGREHTPGPIELNHQYRESKCRWYMPFYGRPTRRYLCYHSIRCIKCEKYLEWSLRTPNDCPDYKEREEV